MNVGLYFGSFNPLHIGHITICRFLVQSGNLDQLRLIVSPRNPLKEESYLVNADERLSYVKKAIKNAGLVKKVSVCDIEYRMSPPLYTINTLRYLRHKEPENRFILIIGADNLAIIEKWHKWQELLQEFAVWVYPRSGYETEELCDKYGCEILHAPLIEISSTKIREAEKTGIDMSQFKV